MQEIFVQNALYGKSTTNVHYNDAMVHKQRETTQTPAIVVIVIVIGIVIVIL